MFFLLVSELSVFVVELSILNKVKDLMLVVISISLKYLE